MGRLRWAIPLLIASCGAHASAQNHAILPSSAAVPLLKQCSRAVPPRGQATWQPSAADIARMEKLLPAALAKAPQARELDIPRVLRTWRRQYVGIVRGGGRFLYGNFFPANDPSEHPGWQSRPVVVCDGGPAFFGAEMEIGTGRITHLAFNGSLG